MNILRKQLPLIIILGLASVLAIFLPNHAAHASAASIVGNAILGIAGGVIGYIAFGIIYIISTIAGVLITLITYFIAVVLQISNHIVDTLAVQSGFTITLAVANLGFVLAIIIIAIATILQRETYGVKKSLWRLVVAAILVNFSLVIGGAFISFANTLTNTFLNQLQNSGNGNGPLAFAQELADAFAPQRALLNNVTSTASGSFTGTINGQAVAANTNDDIASLITPIIGIFSAAALLIVIVITLAVLLIMLLFRYVALAFLLVLMPFAWLLWLFPGTKKHWSSWWNEFIRWTFFAPIVVFFLWLAIRTAQVMHNNLAGSPLAFAGAQYQPSTLTGVIGAVAGSILQGVIVVGLAVGGMYVANRLSIMGAAAGYGAVKSIGTAAGNYVGRRSRQAATYPLRTETVRQRFAGMQQRGNLITRWTGRLGEAAAVWGGEKAAGGYSKTIEGLTRDQALNQLTTSNAMRRQAILARADKEGWHDDPRLQKYLGEERKGEAKRYGNEKLFGELRDKSGRSLSDAVLDPTKTKAEIDAEVKKLAAKNAEALATFFTDSTSVAYTKMVDEWRKKGIAVPITLKPGTLAKARQEIVKSFSELSSTNASSLLTEISKKNNLHQFQDAVQTVERTDPAAFAATQANIRANAALYRWITRGGHRTLIDLRTLFHI
jgi:hypothetical protein